MSFEDKFGAAIILMLAWVVGCAAAGATLGLIVASAKFFYDLFT